VRLSNEQEMWFGVTGVLIFAAVIAVLVIGISAATIFRNDPGAERTGHFGQCYNESGPNCVVDGDTAYVRGEEVVIAGMEAPQVDGARCDAERSLGIEASLRLGDLLSSGNVKVGSAFQDELGREVRTVSVQGKDVARTMISAELARNAGSKTRKWC